MTYATVQKLLIPLVRSRIKTIERPTRLPPPPYVIAANHVDFLDGFLVAAALLDLQHPSPIFISKTSNYGWTHATLQINPDDPSAVLDAALRRLRQGQTICLFVEGSRNHTPTLLPGRTGAVRLALAAKVPIIPIGLQGLQPNTFFFASAWHLWRRPRSVTVRIGEAITFPAITAPTHDDLQRLTTDVMRRLAPLCGKQLPLA